MRSIVMTAAIGLLFSTGTASAQDTYHWLAPAGTPAQSGRTYFPMGTPLALRTRTEVNTKQSKPGDRLYLEVAESLTYRGQIVVPIGAPAVGEVVRSERNGHFGKKGTIEIRLLQVETPYGPARLSGGTAQNGKGAGLLSIGGAIATLGWGPLLIHGTSGYIRNGTVVTGYLAETLLFDEQAPAASVAMTSARPDDARQLPARFDPSVFGGKIPPELLRR